MSGANPYRLPTDVVPTRYDLFLAPELEAARFTGSVTIDLEVRAATREVSFNLAEIELGEVTLTSADGTRHDHTYHYDPEFEKGTLTLAAPLPVGPATLRLEFAGELNDRLTGFYRSTFTDAAGVPRTIATTQMESTDARRAFPCWDEPTFKATFAVTLRVPADAAAYSNGPIVAETTHDDGTRTVEFKETMKMSTYLVAAVVGPFEESATIDVGGVPLRVVCPIGKKHLADFALEAGRHALEFYTEYFGIPYPADKLDLVAIPDFAFGAMENLGCVTFRETALLVDPQSASTAEMERVAAVIAHEIAHMWFGDLVTMAWWEGIWLNEAFATFMESLCTDHFRPAWNKWLSEGNARDLAQQIDGLHSTRPIEFEVIAPKDNRAMYDALTYEKGSAVLRMCEQYLGPEVFRRGISQYLADHAYANTVTADLWDALEAASGEPVRQMMDTWILQGGLPEVTWSDGTLTQAPFAYGPVRGGTSAIGERWLVPVALRPLDGTATERILLDETRRPLAHRSPATINGGGWGVYRSRYGAPELAALRGALDQLTALERFTLVSDVWAGVLARRTPWREFDQLARDFGPFDEPATWTAIAQGYEMVLRGALPAQRPRVAADVRDVFGPHLARLGWDPAPGEPDLAGQTRAVMIGALGDLGGDPTVRERARTLFVAERLDGDIGRAALRATAALGRREDYEEFLARTRRAQTPQEQERYRLGLAEFSGEAEILDATERCFSEFRSQDGPILLTFLLRNRAHGPAVWAVLRDRWDEALRRFPPRLHTRMFGGVSTFIGDRALAESVATFLEAHPIAGEQLPRRQVLERLMIGVDFAEAVRAELGA